MRRAAAVGAAALAAGTALVFAERAREEWPRETETFRPGKGAELANARCLACHSADYVGIQPPMPRPFWKAAVEKMRDKYGAEIPEEEVDILAAYLARVYGTEKSAAAAEAPRAAFPAAAHKPEEVLLRYGCFSCHAVEARKVGPAFRDVAAKYRGNKRGRGLVARQIRKGGGGQWGPKPMPGFSQIARADVEALADWILRQAQP